MRRRNFIAGLSLAVVMGAAQAQPTRKVYRIAIAHPSAPAADLGKPSGASIVMAAIFDELRRLGYVEGQNLVVERYSGEGRAAHYPDLAREIVSSSPDLIIASSNNLVLDLKAATTSIPIVGSFNRPHETGIVPSLARPGGNVTGATGDVGWDQWAKRVELLKEAVPQLSRLGILSTRNWREIYAAEIRDMARSTSVFIVGPPLEHPIDALQYRRVFSTLADEVAEALLVNDLPDHWVYRGLIIELAEKDRLPAIYVASEFVQAGGLMAYGISIADLGRRTGRVVDQILKGTNPGEIPISQPTAFELSINLKTAKTLGIELPLSLLARAERVIE